MRYASFVIRFWNIEADESATDSGFRGRIEHVQSGDVGTVIRLDDVLAFMQERIDSERGDLEDDGAQETNQRAG